MAHMLTHPAAPAPDRDGSLEIGRAAEDYLDWVENHQRQQKAPPRVASVLMVAAFTLTAASIAAIAFAGF